VLHDNKEKPLTWGGKGNYVLNEVSYNFLHLSLAVRGKMGNGYIWFVHPTIPATEIHFQNLFHVCLM